MCKKRGTQEAIILVRPVLICLLCLCSFTSFLVIILFIFFLYLCPYDYVIVCYCFGYVFLCILIFNCSYAIFVILKELAFHIFVLLWLILFWQIVLFIFFSSRSLFCPYYMWYYKLTIYNTDVFFELYETFLIFSY